MAETERTGMQKAVLVFSILSIIGAVLVILMGIALLFAAIFFTSPSASSIPGMDAILRSAGTTMSSVAQLSWTFGLLYTIIGVLALVAGIVGVRASHGASKGTPLVVLTAVILALTVIMVIADIALGNNGLFMSVTSIIFFAAFFVVAIAARRDGARRAEIQFPDAGSPAPSTLRQPAHAAPAHAAGTTPHAPAAAPVPGASPAATDATPDAPAAPDSKPGE